MHLTYDKVFISSIQKHDLYGVKQQISDYLHATNTINKFSPKVEHQHKHQLFYMI